MRKILSILLALALIVSLAACAPSDPAGTTPSTEQSVPQTHPAETDPTASRPTEPEVTPPAETTPTVPAPTEPLPTAPAPTAPRPTEPQPTRPVPTVPPTEAAPTEPAPTETEPAGLDEHGVYTTAEDVGLFIHIYGRLPDNFVTKSEYSKLGKPADKCVGGDVFQNREGLLPKAPGRTYRECDIDTLGKHERGAKRIVYSNDGLVFYTTDHYASFTQLYGEVS